VELPPYGAKRFDSRFNRRAQMIFPMGNKISHDCVSLELGISIASVCETLQSREQEAGSTHNSLLE
jgi:hypothetical protein